jgi:haloalkane dehalogenase
MDTAPTPHGTVTTHAVRLGHDKLHVVDRHGTEPAYVLMHGFPDDSRIYDRLAPLLAPRRVVAFDFMGYGSSDRADTGTVTGDRHQEELAAVLDALGVDHAVLVAHDASGPVAVDHALTDSGRVDQLVLLNTYYGHAASLRLPEMIRLLADRDFAPLADAMLDDPDQRLWLLGHTARRLGIDPLDPEGIGAAAILPQFFGDADNPDALAAIRSWTAALYDELDRHDATIADGKLAALDLPVTLVFGARDDYLNPDLAHHLAGLFTHSDVHIVEGASHWPQWDQPGLVAELIRRSTTS